MKVLKFLFIFSFGVIFLSCEKEPVTNPVKTPTYFMTAKIGSDNFKADSEPNVSEETTSFVIKGVDKEGNSIVISLKGMPSVSTFLTGDIVDGNSITYTEGSNVWISTKNVGAGSIVIEEITDNYIKGDFSFTGINSIDKTEKSIYEGKFNAKR